MSTNFSLSDYADVSDVADRTYSGEGGLSKYDEVMQASKDKLESLKQLTINREAVNNSWAGQLVNNPQGLLGTLANFGATVVESSSREAGQILTAPLIAQHEHDNSKISDADFEAYNRSVQGKATPADNKLLDSKAKYPPVGLEENLRDQLTTRQRFQQMGEARKKIDSIQRTADINQIVDPSRRNAFTKDLKDTWNANVNQVEEGGRDLLNFNPLGAFNALAGEAKMVGGAIADIVTNPIGAIEAGVAQAPQVVMAAIGRGKNTALSGVGATLMGASNTGYAAQYYAKGIEKYQQDNGGTYPSALDRAVLKAEGASLAISEHVADSALLKSVLPKSAAEGLSIAAQEASRAGFKNALKNTGLETAKQFRNEALTEAYQTKMEGEVSLEPVTGADVFAGGIVGGVAGGGIGGVHHGLAEMTSSTPEDIQLRKAKVDEYVAYREAVKNSDVSAMSDSTNMAYDPVKAIRIISDRSKDPAVEDSVRATNLASVDALVTNMTKDYDIGARVLTMLEEGTPAIDKAATELVKLHEKLATIDPADTKTLTVLNNAIKTRETAIEMAKDPSSVKTQQIQVMKLDKQLREGLALQSKFTDDSANTEIAKDPTDHLAVASKPVDLNDTAAVETAQKSIEILINRSMASSSGRNTLTHEQATNLAADTTNALTEPQRDYLRVFSAARIAENELKNTDSVNSDIYKGSAQNLGLAQYRRYIEMALANGNQDLAHRYLNLLSTFASGHANKSEVSNNALDDAQKNNRAVQVIHQNGSWRIVSPAETPLTPDEMRAGGFVTARPKPTNPTKIYQSENLIRGFVPESNAITALLNEKVAAYELRFTPVSTIPSTVVPAVTASNPSVNPLVTPASTVAPTVVAPSPTSTVAPITPVAQTPAAPTSVAPVASIQASVTTTLKNATRNNRLIGTVPDPVAQDLLGSSSLPATLDLLSTEGLTSVAGVLGAGAGSIVLDTNLGALRMGVGPLANPVVSPNVNQVIKSGVVKGIRYEVSPKADTSNITDKDVADMTASLAAEGLVFSDPGKDNLGRVNGKLVVIDSGSISKAKVAETTATSEGAAVAPVAGVVEAATPVTNPLDNQTQEITATQAQYDEAMRVSKSTDVNDYENTPEAISTLVAAITDGTPIKITPNILSTPSTSLTETPNVKTTEAQQSQSEKTSEEAKPTVLKQDAVEVSEGDIASPVTEDAAPVAPIEAPGKLGIFSKFQEKLVGTANESYRKTNLIAQYLKQSNLVQGAKSQKALLAVKDFLSSWNANPRGFISKLLGYVAGDGQKLTPEQGAALKNFKDTVYGVTKEDGHIHGGWITGVEKAFSKHIVLTDAEHAQWTKEQKAINALTTKKGERVVAHKKGDPFTLSDSYSLRDLMQFFYIEGNPKADTEENVKAAIMTASYQFLLDLMRGPAVTETSQLLKMHQQDKNTRITTEGELILQQFNMFQNPGIIQMGKTAVQALGIRNRDENTPMDLLPRLEAALGSHALELLVREGYIKIQERNAKQIESYFYTLKNGKRVPAKESKGITDRTTNHYLEFSPEGEALIETALAIKAANKGAGDIVGKVFGIELAARMPSTLPTDFNQAKTKGSRQDVPNLQKKVGQAVQQIPHKIIPEMLTITRLLGKEAMVSILGGKAINENDPNVHKDNIPGMNAKNASIENQIDLVDELVGMFGIAQEFFASMNVWKNNRSGFNDIGMNLQTSKYARGLFSRPKWTVDLKFDDTKFVNEFLIALAMAMGSKTDQRLNSETLSLEYDMVNEGGYTVAKFKDQAIMDAAEVLKGVLINGEGVALTDAQIELVRDVTSKEGMMSLQALNAYAQYLLAIEKKQDSFKFTMLTGADGKTNGPMLTLLALGAADYKTLNRGGMFSMDKGQAHHFSEYYGQEGALDLYQHLGSSVFGALMSNLKSKLDYDQYHTWSDKLKKEGPSPFLQEHLDALQTITGVLKDGDKVSKVLRNMVKTPITAFFFGSSLTRATNTMAEDFISLYTSTLEDIKSGKSELPLKEFEYALNTLIQMGGGDSFITFTTIEAAMKQSLRQSQEAALHKAFDVIVGESARAVLQTEFQVLIERKNTINQSITAAFDIYAIAYNDAKEAKIKSLMAKEELASTEKQDGIVPMRDLTEAEDAEVRESIAGLLPRVHTAYSLKDKSLKSGISMVKTKKDVNDNIPYKSIVAMWRAGKRSIEEMRSNAFSEKLISPGVGGLSYIIHMLDSANMFNAMDEHSEALNVHDEIAHGIKDIGNAATSINKATVETMLDYSPAREVRNTLNRSIISLAKLAGKKGITPSTVKMILESWTDTHNKRVSPDEAIHYTEVASYLVQHMAESAYSADVGRLHNISEMAYMDQYTWEGGSFEVTEDTRDEAKKQLAELSSEVDPEVLKAVELLNNFITSEPKVTAIPSAPVAEEDASDVISIVKSITDLGLSGVQAGVLIEALKKELPKLGAVISSNSAIVKAINALSSIDKAKAIQILAQAGRTLGATVSPFGVLGTPAVKSNEKLLNWLKDNNGKVSFAQAIEQLGGMSTNPFYTKMLKMVAAIERAFPTNTTINLVTPDSKLGTDVMDAAHMDSRGWYVVGQNTKDNSLRKEIYVLSPDFVHSGLTGELLLHEMLHAVLGGVITRAQSGNPAKGGAAKLVVELEVLRAKAKEFLKGDTRFDHALVDIHEFVSWGMTNHAFQQEVLMKVKVPNRISRNRLVTAMKEFISNITSLFFANQEKSEDAGGMSMFLASVSGLMHEAGTKGTKVIALQNRSMASTPTTQTYTTTDIYDALPTKVSGTFSEHLKGVLSSIVEKLHGPSGSLKEAVMKDSPRDTLSIFTDSLYSGTMPFASQLFGANIRISDQEAFVMEQVEVTTTLGLAANGGNTWAVHKELSTLYQDMKNRLTAADFEKDGRTKEEAETLYKTIFNQASVNKDGRSDYLSRFMAMGLGHEFFNKILQIPTTKSAPVKDSKTIVEKLKSVFGKLLTYFNGRITQTKEGQRADLKLESLLRALVAIETKRKESLIRKESSLLDFVDSVNRTIRRGKRSALHKISGSKFLLNSTNVYVRAAGTALHVYSTPILIKHMFANIDQMRNSAFSGVQGVGASILNNLTGPKVVLDTLLRAAKNHQNLRQSVIDMTDAGLLHSFDDGGDYLSDADKSAVTAILVRSGAHVLLDNKFTLAQITGLVKNPKALASVITDYKHELTVFAPEAMHFFLKQANALGYQLATGETTVPWLLRNASNIAFMYGSPYEGKLTTAEHAEATRIIDVLTTLHALEYSSPKDIGLLTKVMEREDARTGNTHGINMVLLAHKELDKQSNERLFGDAASLMLKGYSSEIYDPHMDVRAAGFEDGLSLMRMGYKKGAEIQKDATDVYSTEAKHLYTLTDGGMSPRVSGLVSFTGMGSKGSKAHGKAAPGTHRVLMNAKRQGIADMHLPDFTFDPRKAPTNHMVPLLNGVGEAVNFTYLMHNSTKDVLLDRDNRFNTVLGAHAGSIMDKEKTSVNNRKVVDVLYQEYDEGYTKDPKAFLEISAESPIAEHRDIYRMLPQSMKDDIKKVWGKDVIMVRSNALDITFGYSKLSISSAFDKEDGDRTLLEDAFVRFTRIVLKQYASVKLGMNSIDAEGYADTAGIRVRRAENAWQALVHETKDILVVKSGVTLLGNELSNKSLLWLYKVPVKDIIMDTKVAWESATAHQEDTNKLFIMQSYLDRGYITTSIPEITAEIARLKDSIARNPVTPLIIGGLMPSIVEDLSIKEDMYSRKSKFTKDIKSVTDKINPTVKSVIDQIYMTHDTSFYKTMSHLTQLSDFTARYVLYQNLTTRAEKTMTHEEAIQEASTAFINYDIPMHRTVQWMDDMGILMFTKYFLGVQRVIRDRFIENPGRTLLLMTAHGYFHWIPSVLVSSMFAAIGGNPFHLGAAGLPFAADDLLSVKTGLSLVN